MSAPAPQHKREEPSIEQKRAMDPAASAWVSANAGSGKTYVLTRRVLRLMLDGSHPSTILSLTFTKTAAAQMAERVFAVLADWTHLDNDQLAGELRALTGAGVDQHLLARARTLFAEAVETPGRLKIQTIHAFCESLLHRFPVEAGVPVGFTVLDETVADQLLEQAISRFFVSDRAAACSSQIDLLTTRWNDADLRQEIRKAMAQRTAIDAWATRGGVYAPEQALAALRRELGLATGDTQEGVAAEILDQAAFRRTEWTETARAIENAKPDLAKKLRAATRIEDETDTAIAYARCFLTASLVRSSRSITNKALRDEHPEFVTSLENEIDRIEPLAQKFLAAGMYATTESIFTITRDIGDHYAALKRRRGGLDYDDLIERAGMLLRTAEDVQWVMYKLDRGIRHVLVDEAQDTSPAQWAIVQALTGDYFAGETAVPTARTAFAVGDPKQSIFSFQGARPSGFDQMRRNFSGAARDARLPFNEERLNLSYRSTPEVLEAVNRVFAVPANAEGLDPPDNAVVHTAHRAKTRGFVDIWPLIPRLEKSEPQDWREPLDAVPDDAPDVVLADQIARFVRDAIAAGTVLPGSGEPLTASDVLILVRTRTGIAKPLIRKLKEVGLDVAGADRLKLLDSIAVEDLLVAAQCTLMPTDDYALACLLKSPLFGWSEDALMALAMDRPGSLINALREGSGSLATQSTKRLDDWRSAARRLRPHEFFARILGPEGGRKAFAERLGPEAEDVLDAFMGLTLSYERDSAGSLAGFAAWLRETDTEIKRDMEAAGRAVRVMTVHGAKGLEAPLVILADAGKAFTTNRIAQNLHLAKNDDDALAPPDHFLVMPRREERTAFAELLREREIVRLQEEWRRLLYVAMTRAEDWLVICGTEPAQQGTTWHGLVADALDPYLIVVPGESFVPADVRRMAPVQDAWAFDGKEIETVDATPTGQLPQWLSQAIVLEDQPPRKAVSTLGAGGASARSTMRAETLDIPPAIRGSAIHRMLELLLKLPEAERDARAPAIAVSLLPDAYAAQGPALADQVLGLLARTELADLFGPGGLSEVPIVGTVQDRDGATIAVTGRIDRLVVNDDEVHIIDYKSDSTVPDDPSQVSERYRDQLSAYAALIGEVYRERTVKTSLLWTATAERMHVPQGLRSRFSVGSLEASSDMV
ncbi:MAG: double-strand break repair helicase AddA [Pseudomonadota bacterium]